MANRRRSDRVALRVPVLIRFGRAEVPGESRDVSQHGLLVSVEQLPALRPEAELELCPPDAPAFRVAGHVVRTAPQGDGRVGIAFDLQLFDPRARTAWRDRLDALRVQAADAAGALSWLEPDDLMVETGRRPTARTPGPPEAPTPIEASLPEIAATFLVKPREIGRLWSFFRSELGVGRVRIETPVLHPPGTAVEVVVIHPESREEWSRIGRVLTASQVGRGRGPMLEIGLDDLDDDARNAFRSFIAHGHSEAAAEPTTQEIETRGGSLPPIPLPPSSPAPRLFPGDPPPVSRNFLIEEVPIVPSGLIPRRVSPELGQAMLPNIEPLVVPPSEARTPPPRVIEPENPTLAPTIKPDADVVELHAADTDGREVPIPAPRSATFAAFFEEFRARHPSAPEVLGRAPTGAPVKPILEPVRAAMLVEPARLGPAPEAPPRTPEVSRSAMLVEPTRPGPTPASQAPRTPEVSRSALLEPVRPIPLAEAEPSPSLTDLADRPGEAGFDEQETGPGTTSADPGVRRATIAPIPAAPITVVGAPAEPPPPELHRLRSRAVGESQRAPHRALSTAGATPELDRDIAVARARVVRSPGSSTACYRLGRLLVRHPDHALSEEGRAQLNRAVELRPEHPSAELARAALALAQGDLGAAEQHLTQAQRLGARTDPLLESAIRGGGGSEEATGRDARR